MSDARPTRLGYYLDPINGDMWHFSANGWSWVNGRSWTYLPQELVWVSEPNLYARADRMHPVDEGKASE